MKKECQGFPVVGAVLEIPFPLRKHGTILELCEMDLSGKKEILLFFFNIWLLILHV
jgi:hypothetical protein